MSKTPEVIQAELQDFFPADVIGWKPQSTSGERALAVAYIDARDVENRLDATVGIDGWKDEYAVLPDGNVVCTLYVRFDGEWIGKTDVGGESDQKDEGDRKKAAFSDSFKRAAVKWGIGRYLYSMPTQWVDFDQQKKTFKRTPVLPDAFTPKRSQAAPTKTNGSKPPPTGAAFVTSLHEFDQRCAKDGLCPAGALVQAVIANGVKLGMSPDLAAWDSAAVATASKRTAELVAEWKAKPKAAPPAPEVPAPIPVSDTFAALIRKAHGYIAANQGYTWMGSLTRFGAKLPANFSNPGNPDEAVEWVGRNTTPEVVQQVVDYFETKVKGKAKKAS